MGGDPRKQRVFLIVSRQTVLDSRYSTVICAPVFSRYDGLSTQIPVGINDGLKHESSIHCDQLVSLTKSGLANIIGALSPTRLDELDQALSIAVGIKDDLQ
jgi:mRNA interferase MazF